MNTSAHRIIDIQAPPRRDLKALITEQLSHVLEERALRFAILGILLVAASVVALVPTPMGVDTGWMFLVPVAIAALATGFKEGMFVAALASVLSALFTTMVAGEVSQALVVGVAVARFVVYGSTAGILGAFAEAHQAVQSKFRRLASIDPLTKVANVTALRDEAAKLELSNAPFSVLVIDVDHLKVLNDTHGHMAGSEAIQLVANKLRGVVRGSDHVARYGGDEFVVILNEANRGGAQTVIRRLRELLTEEELSTAPGAHVQVSAGVAVFGVDGTNFEELMLSADVAMYSDKRARDALRHAPPVAI
jgi:diguanylate cyclase (GGDEF)-like protein